MTDESVKKKQDIQELGVYFWLKKAAKMDDFSVARLCIREEDGSAWQQVPYHLV